MTPPNPALNRTAAGESVPYSGGSERRCRLAWRSASQSAQSAEFMDKSS